MRQRCALFLIATTTVCAQTKADEQIRNAIVKVYATFDSPSYSRPWLTSGQHDRTGSGAIIPGRRILTNAHIVSDQTFIQVRRAGKADKFVATVETVSHKLDLAILKVSDEAFFEDVHPLEIGSLPHVGERVLAYGFPAGGTRITVTEGVVSRIDRNRYSHSGFANMVCQIDAAINRGSSGGPVVSKGLLVGVTFQSSHGQSIGYMIPAPVVMHLLEDLDDGSHDGVPGIPIMWQNMENPQIRTFYGMKEHHAGIRVSKVGPSHLSEKMFQPGDIVLAIDGFDVANDGTVPFRESERISFAYLVDQKQINGAIRVRLLREEREIDLEIPLNVPGELLPFIPRIRYETPATYYITAGLVFTPLTKNYLSVWSGWAKVPLRLKQYYNEMRAPENEHRKEVIVLMEILADEINVGYKVFEDSIVSEINGRTVNSMQDVVDAFESNGKDYHRIVFEPYDTEIVLSSQDVKERSESILLKYKVSSDRSKDLATPAENLPEGGGVEP